jgi:serine phosphatase RsbU (regulator of sigma subunit)
LLADVSGHGEAAAGLAKSLRDLLRQSVNKPNQEEFVAGMNREFGRLGETSGFATAVVATFFEPTQTLDLCIAGHPYPIYYLSERKKWVHLDPASADNDFENMPLGILDETIYPRRKINTKTGDMFLLYTDAFIESATDNENESLLGVKGVVQLLNDNREIEADKVIPFLRDRIGSMAEGNLVEDDASLILGRFTKTKVRMRDNLLAPVRLLGNVADRTTIQE